MLSEHVHTLIIVFKLSMTLQTTSAGRGKGRTWWNSMIRRPRVKNVDSAQCGQQQQHQHLITTMIDGSNLKGFKWKNRPQHEHSDTWDYANTIRETEHLIRQFFYYSSMPWKILLGIIMPIYRIIHMRARLLHHYMTAEMQSECSLSG